MKNLKVSSWILSALTLVIGCLLLYFKVADYGFSFFMIFPVSVGFSIGLLTFDQKRKAQWISILVGLIVSLCFLVLVGIEGLVCVLMALPLMAILMAIGFWIAKVLLKRFRNSNFVKPGQLNAILFPILILIVSNYFEGRLRGHELIIVSNSIQLDYPCDQVFDEVKAMDKLEGEKPWLLQLGLPTPYKCILESDKIGAKRVCLFDEGQIVAEITEFQRGQLLRMKVNEYTLTGNHWFKFKDADYTLKKDGLKTLITRTTSYESILKPRFYWKFLEVYGIEQEHKFVLSSLKKNLEDKYGIPKSN